MPMNLSYNHLFFTLIYCIQFGMIGSIHLSNSLVFVSVEHCVSLNWFVNQKIPNGLILWHNVITLAVYLSHLCENSGWSKISYSVLFTLVSEIAMTPTKSGKVSKFRTSKWLCKYFQLTTRFVCSLQRRTHGFRKWM